MLSLHIYLASFFTRTPIYLAFNIVNLTLSLFSKCNFDDVQDPITFRIDLVEMYMGTIDRHNIETNISMIISTGIFFF